MNELDSIIQQYNVPMSGAVKLQVPHRTTQQPITVEDAIEEMANATGADSPDVKALEKRINDLTATQKELEDVKRNNLNAYNSLMVSLKPRQDDMASCTYDGNAIAAKKYKCLSGYHNRPYKDSESESIRLAVEVASGYQKNANDAAAQLAAIYESLPKLKQDLITMRESAILASMTPEDRNNQIAATAAANAATATAATTAAATAAATTSSAQIKAQAEADGIMKAAGTKSKTMLIVGIAIAVTVLAVGTFWIVGKIRKPKLAAIAVTPVK